LISTWATRLTDIARHLIKGEALYVTRSKNNYSQMKLSEELGMSKECERWVEIYRLHIELTHETQCNESVS